MKVMVMIKGDPVDEGKIAPTEEMLREMGAYNEELVKAGIMLDGNGLHNSARGAKVHFEGGNITVVDGPFTEAKEIIAGYWIWEVKTLEEAVEWAKRCPQSDEMAGVLEIRQVHTDEDFGEAFTDELREQEQRLRDEIQRQHGD